MTFYLKNEIQKIFYCIFWEKVAIFLEKFKKSYKELIKYLWMFDFKIKIAFWFGW